MRSSGGPTWPSARLIPGMVWQAAHPYRAIALTPRAGSPPVNSAASLRTFDRQPLMTTASSTAATPLTLRHIVFSIEKGTASQRGVPGRDAAECDPAL